AELMQSLELRDRLKRWLHNLSLQNLPISTVRQLRKTIKESIRSYIQNRGSDLLQGLSSSINWEETAAIILSRLRNSAVVNTSLEVMSKELALVLERYLERDLEKIVAQTIPILNIDQVIIERVKATSPADLEAAIEGIVKNELQAIVNLGGILGFVVGLIQTALLFLR
ncbi:MAG TPA: DUF445 domain-containing protein, partial [Cyanobacteria bacterium UBA11372]|nr:DUF445 domain-containing protein [Cyanobacteria bacterium UBA11372]